MKALRYNLLLWGFAVAILLVLFKVMPQVPGTLRSPDVAAGADSSSITVPVGAGNGFANGASY